MSCLTDNIICNNLYEQELTRSLRYFHSACYILNCHLSNLPKSPQWAEVRLEYCGTKYVILLPICCICRVWKVSCTLYLIVWPQRMHKTILLDHIVDSSFSIVKHILMPLSFNYSTKTGRYFPSSFYRTILNTVMLNPRISAHPKYELV